MPQIRNNVRGNFEAGFAIGVTTLVITAEAAALLDAQNLTSDFYLTVFDIAYLTPSKDPNFERIYVTTRDGQNLEDVTRGTGGTTESDHNTAGHTYGFISSIGREEYEEIVQSLPIQVSDVPFGVQVYDCLYAKHPFSAAASAALVANQIYAFPFEVKKRKRISGHWYRFNAGGGAKNFRIGIWNITSRINRYPAAKISDVIGSGTSLGFVIANDLWLEAGWYWMGVDQDVTNAVMAVPVTALENIGSGFSAVAGPTMIAGLKVAHAFEVLPDPFPAGASLLTAADQMPFIGTSFSE